MDGYIKVLVKCIKCFNHSKQSKQSIDIEFYTPTKDLYSTTILFNNSEVSRRGGIFNGLINGCKKSQS